MMEDAAKKITSPKFIEESDCVNEIFTFRMFVYFCRRVGKCVRVPLYLKMTFDEVVSHEVLDGKVGKLSRGFWLPKKACFVVDKGLCI